MKRRPAYLRTTEMRESGDEKRTKPKWLRLRLGDIYGGLPSRVQQDGTLAELASSIAKRGLLQPIVVRRSEQAGRFALVCGARRLAACKMLGIEEIDALCIDADEQEAIVCFMEEHVTAVSPNVLDCAALLQKADGREATASSPALARYFERMLALLTLPRCVKGIVRDAHLNVDQAEPLLRIKDESRQMEAASIIAQRELTPMQVRRLVNGPSCAAGTGKRRSLRAAVEEISALTEKLRRQGIASQVSVTAQDCGLRVQITLQRAKR